MFKKSSDGLSIAKGILFAYSVLLLHILLLVPVVLLIFFLRGLVDYMLWVLFGFVVIFCFIGWFLYQSGRFVENRIFSDLGVNTGNFIEMNFLWGLIAIRFRLGRGARNHAVEQAAVAKQCKSSKSQETTSFARLLNGRLITRRESSRLGKY